MKKTFLILTSLVLALSLTGCSTTKIKDSGLRGDGISMASRGRTIIDYKSSMFGSPIPEWVKYVTEGKVNELPTVMPNLKNKKIFVAVERGDDLDFLETWAHNVGIKSQVAEILESNIALAVETSLDGAQIKNKSSTTKSVKALTEALTSITLTGLQEESDFWIQTEKRDDNGDVVETIYEYYLVYSIDEDIFQSQLDQALEGITNVTTEAEALKEIIRVKMEEQVLY